MNLRGIGEQTEVSLNVTGLTEANRQLQAFVGQGRCAQSAGGPQVGQIGPIPVGAGNVGALTDTLAVRAGTVLNGQTALLVKGQNPGPATPPLACGDLPDWQAFRPRADARTLHARTAPCRRARPRWTRAALVFHPSHHRTGVPMQQTAALPRTDTWPALPYAEWKDTLATLHMWTQIVGKIRMTLSPPVNHWWHVPLYVCARGLTTTAIPHGVRSFEMELDFIAHQLVIRTCEGDVRTVEMRPRTVADFYGEVMGVLDELGLAVRIRTLPQEVADPIPFEQDTTHVTYDAEAANRGWRVLAQADRVMREFRGRYLGKSSPVHFFWGSFDLAVTRFSGRDAPVHPGAPGVADGVTREAYSHEVSSAGFWPGNDAFPEPAFYAYFYPGPEGYAAAKVGPEAAYFSTDLGEWLLPYEAVRTAADPDAALMEFLQTSYAAGADLAGWDRAALER